MTKNNKLNFILIVGGIAVVLIVLFLAGRSTSDKSSAPADLSQAFSGDKIVAEEFSFDFGQISINGGKVSHDFKIKNISSGEIKLERLYTSCMCTTAVLIQDGKKTGPFGMPGHGFVPSLRKILGSGEEVTIKVDFDPAAHGPAGVGPTERVVYLEGKEAMLAELAIKAMVTP